SGARGSKYPARRAVNNSSRASRAAALASAGARGITSRWPPTSAAWQRVSTPIVCDGSCPLRPIGAIRPFSPGPSLPCRSSPCLSPSRSVISFSRIASTETCSSTWLRGGGWGCSRSRDGGGNLHRQRFRQDERRDHDAEGAAAPRASGYPSAHLHALGDRRRRARLPRATVDEHADPFLFRDADV